MTRDPDAPAPPPSGGAPDGPRHPMVQPADIAQVLGVVRTMVKSGRQEEARKLVRQVIATAPTYEEPWLQLLALDPPPAEEIELLEAFLQHHPQHRFANAFRTRLNDMQIVAMLGPSKPEPAPESHEAPAASIRLGDYLISQRWVTAEQVNQALETQRQWRNAGVEHRLGTILLMNGAVKQEQLAIALAEARASGFGEFGNYLVRTGVATAAQVGAALARQSAFAAELERGYRDALAAYQNKSGGRLLGRRMAEPQRQPVPKLGEVMVSMGLLTAAQVETILRAREKEFHSLFE